MKILNILEKITETETTSGTRREALMQLLDIGKSAAMAAMPLAAFAAIPQKAKAATADVIIDTLNFALKLEYLEDEFYRTGLTTTVINSADRTIFQQISKHETAHVAFLKSAISAVGGTPDPKPTFDFTAGGQFNPFVVYADFLALSQAFEDTGVRAYKGQAGNLMSDNATLTAALRIHSTEARHAAEVRYLRYKRGMETELKPWIRQNSRGTLPAATQPVYNGDENTTQAGINVVSVTSVGADAVTESFDEPLSKQAVLDIAMMFIV